MLALAGAAGDAAAGGLTGALLGMGIPEYEAKRYEGKVKDGNILMSAHTEGAPNATVRRQFCEGRCRRYLLYRRGFSRQGP